MSWRALVCVAIAACLGGSTLAEDAAAPVQEKAEKGETTPQKKDAMEPGQAIREVFASRLYEFCHDEAFPLTSTEKRWCDLGAGNNASACPTLREACKREALAKQIEPADSFVLRLPDLGLPMRAILWGLLGLAVALLIFLLIRHFLDRAKHEVVVDTASPDAGADQAAAALAREVETDVQRLLERARHEAAAGDFRAAIGSVYAALLRRLEGAGVVRIEPDQTNGDYLRRVKAERPAIATRMAEVVDAVERAQFAENAATREGWDSVFPRVSTLLAERIGSWLAIAGLLLLGAACGRPRADWDHSPSGRAGVMAFLAKRGFDIHERLISVAKVNDSKDSESKPDECKPGDSQAQQLVLLPGAQLGDEEWKALRTWLDGGTRTIVIAGGKRVLPGWIGMRIVQEPSIASDVVAPAEPESKRWGLLRARLPEANRVDCQSTCSTLLRRRQTTYAALRRFADPGDEKDESAGRVLLLADDGLFRNASLLVADNALVLDALLRDGGTSVELAGDLTGLVSSNPVESVQRGRLGPALLQLAAFLLLLFVGKGARFGRPVSANRQERREFAQHVRALGLHYARAHGERAALGFLGAYAVERLRERCGLRVDRSLGGLAEAVATRTGRTMGEVMRMFVEARDAGKGVPAEKGARDLETANELVKLLEETGGTSGHKRIQSHV